MTGSLSRDNTSPAVHISHFLLGAEGALKHMKEIEAKLKMTFSSFQIPQSGYCVCAGFNESLIELEVGYVQEIHAFTMIQVPASSLITELGKLFSPYPGVLFTSSSSHQTPVFKDDGSVWDFDELLLSRNEKYHAIDPRGTMNSDIIVAHACGVLNDAEGTSSSASSTGGGMSGGDNRQARGDSRRGNERHGEDQNPQDHSNNQEDDCPDDGDPGDPNFKRKATAVLPDVSFDVLANIHCNGSDGSSIPFQELQINGTLTPYVCSIFSPLQ
jgi:hypothetical protein